MSEDKITTQTKRLYTVKEFVNAGYYPNEGGLRAIIFRANSNGFNRVIKRINRKIFLDVDEFYQWVNDLNPIGGV